MRRIALLLAIFLWPLAAQAAVEVHLAGELQPPTEHYILLGAPYCQITVRTATPASVPVWVYPVVAAATGICDEAVQPRTVEITGRLLDFFCVGDVCTGTEPGQAAIEALSISTPLRQRKETRK